MQKRHKLKSTIIGLFLIATILITGTFAFQLFNQSAFNPARVEVDYLEGGRIHDDFEFRGPDDPQHGERDKDVFAENFGEIDLMVRVQFREFLSLNGDAIGGTSVGPAVINNPATWPVAMFTNPTTRQAGSYSAEIGEAGIGWTLGNAAGVQKVFMPTHNQVSRPNLPVDPAVPAPFNTPNSYRFSNTTGSGVEAIADFNISDVTSVQDIIDQGTQTGAQTSNGTHDFWTVGQPYTSNLIFVEDNEITVEAGVTHYAQPTLTATNGGIMLVADFIAAGEPAGNFWILDPATGWFYWNGYLLGSESREELVEAGNTDPLLALPTTATSLLLNGVNIPRHRDLEYVIHINADWFTTETVVNLEPQPNPQLFPPITFSQTPVTVNDANLVVTSTVGGTMTGAITLDTSALPAGVTAVATTNSPGLITVTGVRPAPGQPAINGTFVVPVTRGGETANLTVIVNLTPSPEDERSIVIDVTPDRDVTVTGDLDNDDVTIIDPGGSGDPIVIVIPPAYPAVGTPDVTINIPPGWEADITTDGDGNTVVTITPAPIIFTNSTVTVNNANLSVTTTVGGTATGPISFATPTSLPAGVTASASGDVITVVGVRPAFGQPAINGTFTVPVIRGGETANLTVIVNLTPVLEVPSPLPPLPQPYPDGEPITVEPGQTWPTPPTTTPGPVTGFDSAIFTLEQRTAIGFIHPGITVNASTGEMTIPENAPHGHEFYLVLTVTLDGETTSERWVIRVEHPGVTFSNSTVTVNNANLSVTTTVSGVATGAITLDTAALPAGVTASVSGDVITVTGVRPAFGQPAIDGTFIVPVNRGGETANLTVIANLTPLSFGLADSSVTVNDANLTSTVTISGNATGATLDTAALPAGVTAEISGSTITVTGVRPAFGQSAIDGTFTVPVTRDGETVNLTVVANLTPLPFGLSDSSVTVNDANLSRTVTISGNATGATLDTAALPAGVTATISGSTITVVGVRPAFGQAAIDGTFTVPVTQGSDTINLTVVANLTPLSFDLSDSSVTVNDANLTRTVTISGNATGATLDTAALPAGVTAEISGSTITVTGVRPGFGQSAIDGTFTVPVTQGSDTINLTVVANLTPLPFGLSDSSVTVNDANLTRTVTISGNATGATLDTAALPAGVTATISGSTITVVGVRPAFGQAAIDGTFTVPVTQGSDTINLTVVANLTPLSIYLEDSSVTVNDANLVVTTTLGGTAMGTISLDRSDLPAEGVAVTVNQVTGLITVTGTRPAFGEAAIEGTFIVLVTQDGETVELTVIVDLTPLPSLTLPDDEIYIDDDNRTRNITLEGTAAGTITLDTSDLPAGVTAVANSETGVITVTGVRPAIGQDEIEGTFTVTITRDGATATLIVNVDLTPGIVLPEVGGSCAAPSLWTDSTGVVWCILVPAADPRGGVGYTLMITRNTVVNAAHAGRLTVPQTWFDNPANTSDELRAIAMDTQVAPSAANNTMLPQSGTMGSGRAFSLSGVEADAYFVNNAARATSGTYAHWWLRHNMGVAPNVNGTTINNNGGVAASGNLSAPHGTAPRGIRPAVWVRQ